MTDNRQATLYLVDDDEAVRIALALLMETMGYKVTLFDDPMRFLKEVPDLEPGCIIMDIRMPMISGLKVQERLAELGNDWPLVVITGHGDIDACRKAFKNGAVDFLSKPVDEQDLIDAIQKGEQMLQQQVHQAAEQSELNALLASLTRREYEVLEMIAKGLTTKEIASALSLSPRTIETHRAHLANKLGTTSVAEMARIVLEARGG